MNRRDFLTAGVRAAVFGFAVYTGLAATRIKQISEYSVLYSYTDKVAEGHQGVPPEVQRFAVQRMGIIAHEYQGRIIGYDVEHRPIGTKWKHDPLGQQGHFGINFQLEEDIPA